uniref:Uncharacterized protein n=1 Tax=Peronospora matthiolae TaxID=2874970 RepID=A0AAV1UJC4_9STRA
MTALTEDDIVIENHSTPTVSENTALRLFKGKTAEEMDEERQQRFQQAMDDTEEEISCDLVLFAMGFVHPEQKIAEALGLEVDQRRNI